MQPQLVVISGPDAGRCFSLEDRPQLLIGRGLQSDTQIADPRISRIHCRIETEGDQVWLLDAGGAGGTLIGGQPVGRHRLRPGESFQIGDTVLRFQLTGQLDEPTLGGAASVRIPEPARRARAAEVSAEPGGGVPVRIPERRAPSPEDLLGRIVGHYRLDAVAHRGNSGVLFKAYDTRQERPAAVKVLTPDLTRGEEQQERFVRAMRAMQPIRHAHIIRLYAAGKVGPFCWAAMEYVDGESLDRVIQRIGICGMLMWSEVWRIAVHIGRALQAAHERRIVHRNLTPTNILQRHSDRVCLLGDLMLAKSLGGGHVRQLTQPGQLLGEVAYMSPERTLAADALDERSDLYGLGATLYALLAGRPPFGAATLPELLRRVRHEQPLPPRTFQPDILGAFEQLVLTLVAKRPQDRVQTATELLAELESIGQGSGLTADATEA